MTDFSNKWIFVGSLGIVFVVTLVFSYGPGYGGSLLAFLNNSVSESPQMSPSDMVTPVVTSKKLVTLNRVTNVTSVSPSMSPTTSPQPSIVEADYSLVSPTPSRVPTATPVLSVTPAVSPQPKASPSPTPTPYPISQSQTTSLPTTTPSPTPATSQSALININTADLVSLESLNGIGLIYAQYIIDYRVANGSFQTIEDIMKVKDIKSARFEKIKDQITVGP